MLGISFEEGNTSDIKDEKLSAARCSIAVVQKASRKTIVRSRGGRDIIRATFLPGAPFPFVKVGLFITVAIFFFTNFTTKVQFFELNHRCSPRCEFLLGLDVFPYFQWGPFWLFRVYETTHTSMSQKSQRTRRSVTNQSSCSHSIILSQKIRYIIRCFVREMMQKARERNSLQAAVDSSGSSTSGLSVTQTLKGPPALR